MNLGQLNLILAKFPSLRVAVLGDFCVDRYFDVDARLARDRSKETGLRIHQVARVRTYPGGSGTVINNLDALGVGEILPVGFIGRDGEGFELREALARMNVRFDYLSESSRRTPAYTKPLLVGKGLAREISRFDIFPREPLSRAEERSLLERIDAAFERADALIVSDYTEAGKSGTVTPAARERVRRLAARCPDKIVLADSRLHIDRFRGVCIKANEHEVRRLLRLRDPARLSPATLAQAGCALARRRGKPVFITLGARGMLVCRAQGAVRWPAFPAKGPIDIVGAGDSVAASVAAALAAGASDDEAGLLGVLVSSITIQQIGVTGVARPADVRARWREYARRFPEALNPCG
jgi:rfaE bifunctional protein kinase chain/domain